MTRMTPAEMASEVSRGLLSFPVTHFDRRGQCAEAPSGSTSHGWLRTIRLGCSWPRGTGRVLFAVSGEVGRIASAAVAETAGGFAPDRGCGYGKRPLQSTSPRELRPPCRWTPASATLPRKQRSRRACRTRRAVCRATRLGVIVYNRDNAILDDVTLARLADRCPNLVGFKDGVGDIETEWSGSKAGWKGA